MTLVVSYPDLAGFYDQLAPDYDRLHRRWLRHAGGEAQAALEATVRAVATPETKLLDAGCGTGAFARRLLAENHARPQITLLDPSDAMLTRCEDIPAERVQGRLERLPFQSRQFDIVTCAWALETATNLEQSLSELCRMVRPGGLLCLAFCARKSSLSIKSRAMTLALSLRGSGRFLPLDAIDLFLDGQDGFETRALPCNGPVAALIVRRRHHL
ncbi:MAG: methyltransferase domain-containing protein [Pseudomonadota bacterium]